jgi:hypothetical protein
VTPATSTLQTLTIQTEAWLQEELAAQRALLALLERVERAALAGARTELEQSGPELERLLAPAAARETRRTHLLEKLAAALGVPARQLTLTQLSTSLGLARIETRRLDGLRQELRAAVTLVLRAGRRLAALAQYHRGVLEELCQLLTAAAPEREQHLIDARG